MNSEALEYWIKREWSSQLKDTVYTITVFLYSLSRLLVDWNITPDTGLMTKNHNGYQSKSKLPQMFTVHSVKDYRATEKGRGRDY